MGYFPFSHIFNNYHLIMHIMQNIGRCSRKVNYWSVLCVRVDRSALCTVCSCWQVLCSAVDKNVFWIKWLQISSCFKNSWRNCDFICKKTLGKRHTYKTAPKHVHNDVTLQVRSINLIPMQVFHVITYPLVYSIFNYKVTNAKKPYNNR